MTAVVGWVQRAVPANPRERSAALWSFAYFFTLLAGYYVLRPLRDQMGIAGGVKNLPWPGVVRLAASKKLKNCALCGDDAGIGASVFVGHFPFTFNRPPRQQTGQIVLPSGGGCSSSGDLCAFVRFRAHHARWDDFSHGGERAP